MRRLDMGRLNNPQVDGLWHQVSHIISALLEIQTSENCAATLYKKHQLQWFSKDLMQQTSQDESIKQDKSHVSRISFS